MMGEELPAADFFDFESLLSVQEQRKLKELRAFLDTEIAPYAGQWWDRAEFPEHILPKLAALRLSAPAQRGYTHLFAGLVIAEMTRVDTSIATFFMVHHDLFVESLYDFGSDAQQDRYLDDGSVTCNDSKVFSLRSGRTQPLDLDALDLATSEDDDALEHLVGELKHGRRKVVAVLGGAAAALCGVLLFAL